MKFSKDPSFRYKFIYALDQHFQRFLAACSDANSIIDINKSYFDLSYIIQSVIHLKFYCDLPAMFLTQDDKSTPALSTKSAEN